MTLTSPVRGTAAPSHPATPASTPVAAVPSWRDHPLWRDWRFDAAFVVGVVALLAYAIPARLVLPGLGAAGVPALVAGLGLLLVWMAARLIPGAFVPGRNPLRFTLGGFVLAVLVSALLAFAAAMPASDVSGADRSLLRIAALVGIALVVLDGVGSRRRLDALLKTVLAGGVFMAVVGALQFHVGLDLTPDLRPPVLVLNASQLVGISARGDGIPRVAATANHYIEFGVLMAMLVPLAFHFAGHAAGRARRAAFGVATALFLAGTFYSVSRSAVVALLVALLVILVGSPRRRSTSVIASVAALAGLAWLAAPALVRTYVDLFTGAVGMSSVESRTSDYPVVFPYIAARPWFGSGPGTFTPAEYLLLDNQWLNALITLGIVGTAALMGVFAVSYVLARRTNLWAEHAADRSLGNALAASIAAAFVASFFFDSLAFSTFAVTTFIVVGASGALWRFAGRPSRPR
jgi:O-antigen ligase